MAWGGGAGWGGWGRRALQKRPSLLTECLPRRRYVCLGAGKFHDSLCEPDGDGGSAWTRGAVAFHAQITRPSELTTARWERHRPAATAFDGSSFTRVLTHAPHACLPLYVDPSLLIKLNSTTCASLVRYFLLSLFFKRFRSLAKSQHNEIWATIKLLGRRRILFYTILLRTLRILNSPECSMEIVSLNVKRGLKNIPVPRRHFPEIFPNP